ncbi:N-acetyltransferase GCN5 [Candidatus Sulfotelmatobacter sp. SbA7]|nr:N-acetyltransferase GCN5 [Candidatus Sulfotelmatobacter sp. SbA7]
MPLARPAKFVIVPFDKREHDRAAFSCEHEVLSAYLKHQASQDIKKHVAAVFILTADGKTIAGYYTLSQYAVDSTGVPQEIMQKLGLPKYKELPATLLGRLARNAEFKGQGGGELLLMGALRQALAQSKLIASVAVVVDSKDGMATRFYKKYGFVELPDHPNRLFLPIKTIEQMFAAVGDANPQAEIG